MKFNPNRQQFASMAGLLHWWIWNPSFGIAVARRSPPPPSPGRLYQTRAVAGGLVMQPRVVIYDGVCNLCNAGVGWIIKRDPFNKIRYCALQSRAAEPYLIASGLDRTDLLKSFLFVEGLGAYHRSSTAALKVLSYLPLPYSVLTIFLVVPRPLRDVVYDYIAKNRYNWFGKSDECILPDSEVLDRFIDREEIIEKKVIL